MAWRDVEFPFIIARFVKIALLFCLDLLVIPRDILLAERIKQFQEGAEFIAHDVSKMCTIKT